MLCKTTKRGQSTGWLLAVPMAIALSCILYTTTSFATEAEDYLRRAAQRDVAMFDTLDREKEGASPSK